MPKIVLAASLVAAFALAACGSPASSPVGQVPPSPTAPASPSMQPLPSEVPVATPGPSADPTAAPTPKPTAKPTPKPTPIVPNAREKYLIAGVRRGAIDCEPVRADLPLRAIAGIECRADDRAIARVGFYLFKSDKDTLNVYLQRMTAEGVELETGGCIAGEGHERLGLCHPAADRGDRDEAEPPGTRRPGSPGRRPRSSIARGPWPAAGTAR